MEQLIELECGHIQARGRNVNAAYCTRCQKAQAIARVLGGYSVRCVTEHCRYGRRFGAAVIMARHGADRHVRQHPTHTVQVRLGGEVTETMRGRGRLTPFPDF